MHLAVSDDKFPSYAIAPFRNGEATLDEFPRRRAAHANF